MNEKQGLAVEPLMAMYDEKKGEAKTVQLQFQLERTDGDGKLDKDFYRSLHSARAKMSTGVSDEQAMMNLIKAVIGTGILSLSQAMHNSGILFGIGLILFTNLMNIWCLRKMIHCAHVICKRTGRIGVDYGEMGELAMAFGPAKMRRYAGAFKQAINIFLYLLQFGSCSVYFIFAAENIRQVADPQGSWPIVVYIAFVLPVEILLVSIRELRYLAIPSTLANLLYLTAFGIQFSFIFDNFPDWRRLPVIQPPAMWPLAFGSIMFAFSSAGTILPIENRCRTPGHLLTWNGVINTSYGIITSVSLAVALFGYIKYGENVEGSITLNLPMNNVLAICAKVMVAVTIILSFPIQFYSPMEVIVPILKKRFKSQKAQLISEFAVRYALVFVTFAFAALVPKLGLFISLVGALTAASLAFLFPTLIDILIHYDSEKGSTWLIAKNAFIFLFGIIGLLSGTITTIEAIVANHPRKVEETDL